MAWFNDPDLLEADCDAEDRFVYRLAHLLAPRGSNGPLGLAALSFGQALLDEGALRSCLPGDLTLGDFARVARAAGVEPEAASLAYKATHASDRVPAAQSLVTWRSLGWQWVA
ncbi:MAG: hypothetical protein OXU20_34440 [Myxococcales bacterium]|nr:hypothetical protein [Myxococcales bacterium]